jgi:hypothetical protein
LPVKIDLAKMPADNAGLIANSLALMKKERLYLLLLSAVFVSTLLILGLFNAIIDPHRFFNLVSIKGLNEYKTYVTKMRLRKPVHIYQRKPTILIMGSSRAGGGLHCQDYTRDESECYNTALRGITTYEQYRLLEHAITVTDVADKKIQQVILKLSYATFTETELTKEGFEESLATHENEGLSFDFYKAILEKYFYALFSWESLTDSRMTIEYQNKPYAWRATSVWNFEKDGSWKTYSLARYENDPALMHDNRSKQWVSSVNAMQGQFTYMKKQVDDRVNLERNYENFARLLELAYRHHLPMKMMFPSEHADYLSLMNDAGMWPYMEEWKRRIVLMNEQIAAQYHSTPYLIWDFGGFNEYSTETSWDQLPVGQSMQWYEDIVHFQGELGAKMLQAMREQQTSGNWFQVVDSHNIEKHLEKIRQDRETYKIKTAKSH